ncbi:MAG: DoxX family protein [Ferruginibacter sp.]|nr:DoxX family protein [Ferruginibacter sp.]
MNTQKLTTVQNYALVLLRVLIGWHFLYEGIIKAYNPSWTSKGYLLSASILKPFFTWIASDSLVSVVDTLNIVGLIAVGASLLIGMKVRWGCIAGILLLLLYYLAHPPFPGLPQGPAEGSYWVVNKNLIEMVALWVIYQFPLISVFGIENLFLKKKTTTI